MPVPTDLSQRGPSRRSLRLRGAALVVAAAATVAGVQYLRLPDPETHAAFTIDAAGIGDGVDTTTQLRLHGVAVGTVTDIEPRGTDHQILTVTIDPARLQELSSSMRIRFVSANVFGTTAIELIPQPGGEALQDGSVVEYRDRIENFTVTNVMRSSQTMLLETITPQLSQALDDAADLTISFAPVLAGLVVVIQSTQHVGSPPLDQLMARLAEVIEATGPVIDKSVDMLYGFLSPDQLDDPHQVELARAFIPAIIDLLFGYIATLADVSAPMAPAVDVLIDYLDPLTTNLGAVSPAQLSEVLERLSAAFIRGPDGRVGLNTELRIGSPPPDQPPPPSPAPPTEGTR
ncbi:MlaD family protein [Nocardia beijingensis]|uniref:MlaD family protein n=1 Tax=Nocardia beijingensis TaxID=95162 RepID=UPI0033A0A3A9